MAHLRELQEAVQAYVLHRDCTVGAEVVATARVDAKTRLDIYAEAYRLRLIEALESDFPALRALLGYDAFSALAHAYIEAHPSGHYSIRYFGCHMGRYLAQSRAYQERLWLAALAEFEWALGEAFDAHDATPIGTEAIAALPPSAWPELRLGLHPSVRRLDLVWNAPATWLAVDREEPAPIPDAFPGPVSWLVWRQGLRTFFRSLSDEEAWALDAARGGQGFGAVCEGLCRWVPEAEVSGRAAGLLRQWIAEGLVVSAQCPPAMTTPKGHHDAASPG